MARIGRAIEEIFYCKLSIENFSEDQLRTSGCRVYWLDHICTLLGRPERE